MLNKLVSIFGFVLICYSSSSYADTCGYAYDPELGWLSEVSIASGQLEPISEVPVPVTVITSQMIKEIGAKSLKDVLITYVPGITFVQDNNEVNVAVRGVSGSSQQQILFLLNGHRLDSRSYSMANPDHNISLDKIQCIEVLRGTSPLYGDVALAALVNIITKKGTDMGGTEINIGRGNHGQTKLSFIHGNEFENGKSDLLLWGAYYKSDGETVGAPEYSRGVGADFAILDGFDEPAPYDIGINYEFGDFTLLATQRYSRYIEPFSTLTGQSYEYRDYSTIHGIGPGLAYKLLHLGMDYDKVFDNDFKWQFQIYYDKQQIDLYPTTPTQKGYIFGSLYERNYGFMTQLSQPYDLLGGGRWTVGIQQDKMDLYDTEDINNIIYLAEFQTPEKNLLPTGKERIDSQFALIKHRFHDNWIGNFGVRFDRKERREGISVDSESVSAALIYVPNKIWDLKLSYSKALADAAYWYRYNLLFGHQERGILRPEKMESFQVTPTIKWYDGKINSSFNVFYNRYYDFIWFSYNQPYKNMDEILKVWGIENETIYRQNAYNLALNFTFQRAIDASEKYPSALGHKIHNVPNWTANAVFNVNPLELFDVHLGSISDDLWLNLTARYIGEQLSPIDISFDNGQTFSEPNHEVDYVLLFNTGFRWNNLWKGLFLDGRVYNLLDEKYYQGGTISHPYPQPGRWWMITVGYQFDL